MAKYCTNCCSNVGSLKVSPQHIGQPKHDEHERVCAECWEAWLSLQVEENRPDQIKCMFNVCKSNLTIEQIGQLSWQGTSFRLAEKLKVGLVCMNRCTKFHQPFDREKDGRVFTCNDCSYQICVDCDRPEHTNETCTEYRARLDSIHLRAEQATHTAFKSCPKCDMLFDTEKCGFTQCNCGYRFCSGCMIPWVGEGSAYLGGKEAHGEDCLYRKRDRPSTHSLKRRFQEADDVQARIDAKDLSNKKKREAKKAVKAEIKEE